MTYILSNEEEKTLLDVLKQSKQTLLYFYPKDMTSGCTKQAIWLKDHYERFQKKGIQIIGVSRDNLKKHQQFVEKYELPFLLIADTESTLCEQFSVIAEKSMYGRKYLGIVRSTFLLDQEGNILQEWRNVKLAKHFEELSQLLD